MLTVLDLSRALRVVGILYLFYLQYVNMVSIPMSVIVMISLGSLILAMCCKLPHTGSFERVHVKINNIILYAYDFQLAK